MNQVIDDPVRGDAKAPADMTAVAVTRWTARLADPQCEREYRLHRFADERRRAFILLGLVSVAGLLNLLVVLDAYLDGAGRAAALVPLFVSILIPLVGLGVAMHMRTPSMLETFMTISVMVGMTARMSVLTFQAENAWMWPVLMIGLVFAIYLYLPLRFTIAVALAVVFSVAAPAWWWFIAGGSALPTDQFHRSLVWLLFANVLGFVAANSLHRSQRAAFAQSLVLRKLLSTDALTGVANRRSFDEALDREWRRCGRSGAPLSLLMIDVDHFKAYNDHWGHQEGDACLRRVARLLVEAVGRPGDLPARYGGEEFVCLLPDVGLTGARAVAARLVAALERANIGHPRSPTAPRLTLSIGIASASELSGEPSELIALADKLLYAAKNSGRNQIVIGMLNEPAAAPLAVAQAA